MLLHLGYMVTSSLYSSVIGLAKSPEHRKQRSQFSLVTKIIVTVFLELMSYNMDLLDIGQ